MKILILGAGGMLGHKLVQLWSTRYDVMGTVRKSAAAYDRYGIFPRDRLIDQIDADDFPTIEGAVARFEPHVVVNCIGIIKQLEAAHDPLATISINSLLPHRLARLCRARGARLIHVSTDCVFSGRKGMYTESDVPDATDLYGRTKLLGEVDGPGCLTLRTSIIGRELESRSGLLEWFLQTSQQQVRGFRGAIYSGFSTLEFARILETVLNADQELTGVHHVSSDPINKYELLRLARAAFGTSTDILPVDTPAIDRSLDSTPFRRLMNYTPPSWPDMLQEMAADETPYSSWHASRQVR